MGFSLQKLNPIFDKILSAQEFPFEILPIIYNSCKSIFNKPFICFKLQLRRTNVLTNQIILKPIKLKILYHGKNLQSGHYFSDIVNIS